MAAPVSNHLENITQAIYASLRPGQQRLADWSAGSLAVSAVPGAGKSTGMAAAAALTIARHHLHLNHQLVLVTFTRSAAANLKARVNGHLRQLGLSPTSFTVSTLHGLALTIATRNPELSNLSLETLTLVSPAQGNRLLRTCIERWVLNHNELYQALLAGQQCDGEETEQLRRQSVLRTEVLPSLAYTTMAEAKSSGLQPQDLNDLDRFSRRQRSEVEATSPDYGVLAIAAGLYQEYQSLLERQGLIDYDDMILAALRTLEDEQTRRFWQNRVFAVFEDEAQDSSPLQTRLLTLLAQDPNHPQGGANLVRVGDPNQAINSTFTPADPVFFNQFCDACRHHDRLITLDQAGRSSAIIMAAANYLLTWVNQAALAGRETPFRPQAIHPVPGDDPQADANPPPLGAGLEIITPATSLDTLTRLAQRMGNLYRSDPNLSLAILVREGRQGRYLAQHLGNPQAVGIDLGELGLAIYDVGEQDRQTRVPEDMLTLLRFMDRPHSPDRLKAALGILVERQKIPRQDLNLLALAPEQFLYPGPLHQLPTTETVSSARRYCIALLRSRFELPAYSLFSFIGLTLGYSQSELATADKLAARVSQQTRQNQSLEATLGVLAEILESERFSAVDTEDRDCLYTRSGQVTIMTMHRAKGLDWDAVFLPFLEEKTLPGSLWVPPQAQFLGDFTLAEVARAQIRTHIHQPQAAILSLTAAWERAQQLKVAEEYRLLYVAMTRAKRLLWMAAAQQAPFTWSKPEVLQAAQPCPALPVLQRWLATLTPSQHQA
ncbi:MAG: ATP-dependent helicase [Cyanobacteria bacterium REEB459]|nr:ATP-dependent helicase [Cyanobacteria bacterium REEB459]